ncbi:hypothetical protein [Bacillus altitudinis]
MKYRSAGEYRLDQQVALYMSAWIEMISGEMPFVTYSSSHST